MPIVTIDPAATEKFPLKTAPADPNDPQDEDGYVVLRPLPYGMKLTRRDKATKMMMRSQPTNGKGRKAQQQTDSTIELESMNEWAVAYDYAYCIVDHNLTDTNKVKIDFTKAMSLKMLDPKVGSEIEKLINSLNEDEDELMLEDFPMPSSTSLMGEDQTLREVGNDLSETLTEMQ